MTTYTETEMRLETVARAIFAKVLSKPGESGRLLSRLFDGDGVTVDPYTREIVYMPAAEIERLASGE